MTTQKQHKIILQKAAAKLRQKFASTPYSTLLLNKSVCEKDEYAGYYCVMTKPDPLIDLPPFLLWIDNSTQETRIWAGFEFSGEATQAKFVRNSERALNIVSTRVYGTSRKEWANGQWMVDLDELTRPYIEAHRSRREFYFGQFDSTVIMKAADADHAVNMATALFERVYFVLQASNAAENPRRDDTDAQTEARKVRRGRAKFRKNLLAAYGGKCAISGCQVEALLDAAHVKPHSKRGDSSPNNGILLRTDLHTLFDEHLLRINPKTLHVELADELRQSEYKIFDDAPVRPPILPSAAISLPNLRERYDAGKPPGQKA